MPGRQARRPDGLIRRERGTWSDRTSRRHGGGPICPPEGHRGCRWTGARSSRAPSVVRGGPALSPNADTHGRHRHGATTAEPGFAGLLLAERPDVHAYIQSTIGALLDYDKRRQAQLITTLQTYLECDGNAAMAARRLYLHVNTMRQRLERIAQLLGDDWHSPKRLLEIQVALHLRSTSVTLLCPQVVT